MPIPFLLIGLGAAASAIGIGKSIKAGIDQKDANETNESARNIVEASNKKAAESREICNKSIENLGRKKLYVLDNSIERFVTLFEQIHNIELSESDGLDELKKFHIDSKSFGELKEMSAMASSVAGGLVGTIIAGCPALTVMGFIVGAKASANKDKAYSNLAEARKFEEEVKTLQVVCKGISMRANMFKRLLIKLDVIFTTLLDSLENVINTSGTDFSLYTADQKKTVGVCLSFAKAIKAVLDTPILDKDGNLTKESETIIQPVQKVIESHGNA